MDEKQRIANSTYTQAEVPCFVKQGSSKFEVQCFAGSSVLKIPAFAKLRIVDAQNYIPWLNDFQ